MSEELSKSLTTKQRFAEILMENNKVSAMRVMSFIALIVSVYFGYLVITGNGDNQAGATIVTGFLMGAFAPKAVQKFAEKK